jgi:Tfp pilus assembly protein PilO
MARSLPKGLGQLSGKRVLVDKANTTVIISAAIAAALVVFSLFASIALIKKIGYQNDVINLRKQANEQLITNLDSTNQLVNSYEAFDNTPESVIGTPDKNSKIILDALPSKYDLPALVASLDGIITGAGLTVESITGVDEELSAAQSSITPTPVPIPFEFSAKGGYDGVQKLIIDLQRSIRPFKINSFDITVDESGVITAKVSGETAYQPAKELGIQELTVDKNGNFVEVQPVTPETTTTTGVAQ